MPKVPELRTAGKIAADEPTDPEIRREQRSWARPDSTAGRSTRLGHYSPSSERSTERLSSRAAS
jgi:hypothetical protein